MKINKSKLKELTANPQNRASASIAEALNNGVEPSVEAIFPFVSLAYETGKHRSPSYIRGQIKSTLRWLQS